ncbi:hypothetical protein STEG23_007279, partial [Scotinomys teguina]
VKTLSNFSQYIFKYESNINPRLIGMLFIHPPPSTVEYFTAGLYSVHFILFLLMLNSKLHVVVFLSLSQFLFWTAITCGAAVEFPQTSTVLRRLGQRFGDGQKAGQGEEEGSRERQQREKTRVTIAGNY